MEKEQQDSRLDRQPIEEPGASSFGGRLFVIHPPPQPGLPAPDSGQKKFNSRLVARLPRGTWFGRECCSIGCRVFENAAHEHERMRLRDRWLTRG